MNMAAIKCSAGYLKPLEEKLSPLLDNKTATTVDWAAVIQAVIAFIISLFAPKPAVKLDEATTAKLKKAGCPDDCCNDVCGVLRCQRVHLIDALADNCKIDCCCSCDD